MAWHPLRSSRLSVENTADSPEPNKLTAKRLCPTVRTIEPIPPQRPALDEMTVPIDKHPCAKSGKDDADAVLDANHPCTPHRILRPVGIGEVQRRDDLVRSCIVNAGLPVPRP